MVNKKAEEEGEEGASQQPLSLQRSRWATRKLTVKSSSLKRISLVGRRHNRNASTEKKRTSGGSESLRQPQDHDPSQTDGPGYADNASISSDESGVLPRTIFFNQPLPNELKDDEGRPLQQYTRNKIRTAKYTPLSFIPKNLWFQFHNIANIFFLFVVILVIFPIFGGVNPGLNAVPLIFIIVVTAIKDAIEDYRRTILDNDLNNAPVHRLLGWENVNVEEDNVSAWRKFKKANSRFFGQIWHSIEALWKKDTGPTRKVAAIYDDPRASIETRVTPWESVGSPRSRQSFVSAREDIQMTPVPSPLPTQQPPKAEPLGSFAPDASSKPREEEEHFQAIKGDLINPEKPISGKARFHRDAWKNLMVGDFVRIYNDDELPADIIILATSDADGQCYVETKNLDGETNLKVRTALRCGRTLKHARDCERAQFIIESEPPQPNLYKYNGAIKWHQKLPGDRHGEPQEMSEPIGIDNMLLRGCNLRNTEWALGVVIFTGHDTKIMMNAGITPSKRARIARELNFNVICNFGILLVMCLIVAIANGIAWGKTDASLYWFEYGSIGGTPGLTGFITFWAAVIVFQNLVPISLYISLEIVRTLQAFFIYSDVGMYYEPIDAPCVPKSWNISDDVGQIEYIFSDKTGTLTQNVMEFKKATINGQPYGEAYTEAQAGLDKRQGVDTAKESVKIFAEIAAAKARALRGLRELHNNPYLHEEDLTFVAPDFVDDMAGKNGPDQKQANEHFMLVLALCHTVIAEKQPGDPPKMLFKAQSPDEAALVATARDMGFTVLGASSDGIDLNVMGEDRHYEVLNTIEFNSTRKRMSSIVRMPNGKIFLFCKGADSVIYSRLKRGEQQELRKETAQHLELFAVEGLRTLCIAERELTEHEYIEWRKEHDIAATALENREEKLEEVADKIEQDLWLLGGTAIEDRLQDGVPDTIELLGDAGIKLWVLTGDKVETAINIGFSCNLLSNDMDLIRLQVIEDETGDLGEDEYLRLAEKDLDESLAKFGMTGSDEELKKARHEHEPPAATHALVVDGFTLRWVLSDGLRQKFLLLCKQCKSVLCCRVSPAQKAAVVAMVKTGLDVMTLSIGDGANDVAMIQEADVGVGIAGVEGRQAVMSSDYAIGQFKFLQRLVLVHGRWSYRRLAETISNFFYKNMVWTWAIFWFQVFCNFDISYIFDYTYILMFNLFFTSVPVVLMGVLDQDVSDTVSLEVPQLYRRGIERLEWTQVKFWAYMFDGIYQSVVSFFIPYIFVILTVAASANGLDIAERTRLGCYIAHPAVITINTYILINTYRWDWLMLLVVAISDLFIFFWTGIFTSVTTGAGPFYGSASQVYQELTFWMCLIVTPALCLLPRLVIKCIQKTQFPLDVDIIREQIKQGKFATAEEKAGKENMTNTGAGLEGASATSSESSSRKGKAKHAHYASVDEDRRPIYPPSVTTTHNTRTQNGSDGTNYTMHDSRRSMDIGRLEEDDVCDGMDHSGRGYHVARPSIDRARPSYDRIRASMDRVRPSMEASNDFTSAARLSRIESSHSRSGSYDPGQASVGGQRRFNLNTVRKRGLSAFSKKSIDPEP
ncbi:phospholipid-transporting ATPase DNF1 [Rhypophila sp. PSN 637]